jgi:DNA-directed RNA polymerase beta subunit
MAIGILDVYCMKHQASETLHVRGEGPLSALTKQATAGAIKDGGQKVGCMEVDCMLCSGATSLTTGLLNDPASMQEVYFCLRCGSTQQHGTSTGFACSTPGCPSTDLGSFGNQTAPYLMVVTDRVKELAGITTRVNCHCSP